MKLQTPPLPLPLKGGEWLTHEIILIAFPSLVGEG